MAAALERERLEEITDPALLVDRQGRLLEVNDAACLRLGYARHELLAMRIDQIDAHGTNGALSRALTRPGYSVFETSMRCKVGVTYVAEVMASATEVDGAPAQFALVRDVADRQRAEAEQRRLQEQLFQAMKMEPIGRLASGIAHDFNNVLTAVLGNVELGERWLEDGRDIRECLRTIREAALSAAALTGQLLTFSRKQVIAPRALDLNDLIGRMSRMLSRLIGEDLEIQTVMDHELAAVRADPGLLEQAVLNLVINARDAMPSGGVLTLRTANVTFDAEDGRGHPLQGRGPHVLLAVSDTGTGLSEEAKAHIFEPFFTTKPPGQGTGLGLAITHDAIRHSGGMIGVASESGKGTTFTIYLPSVDERAVKLDTSPPMAALRPAKKHEVVLVVEDDPRVREVAALALGEHGYEVLVAANGQDALALAMAREEPIHLVLTDMVMPRMGGRQLVAQVTRLHAEAKVLYTSGYDESIAPTHGVPEQRIDFLSKPYTVDLLIRRVREALDARP